MAKKQPPKPEIVIIRYEQQLITQRELMKENLSEGRTFRTFILTSFTVFLAINALLLKLSFDSKANGDEKCLFFTVGALTSVFFLVACIFMWLIRKSIIKDIKIVNEMSDVLNFTPHSQLASLKYVTITTTLWTVTSLLGWLVLLKVFTDKP